jgi:DNA-binding NarL/FixJ family response regulator
MAETKRGEEPDIRVLVADDQRLVRDGIASLLSIQEGIEIVGIASNGQEALDLALALTPDVVLMDIRMPVMDGVEAARLLRSQLPDCQILMLTTFNEEEFIVEALRAGACGYLLKDIPAHDLAGAIRSAHKGIYQLDATVASKVFAGLARDPARITPKPPRMPGDASPGSTEPETELSARELEVLRLIARGATNREIAEQLVISEGTVKNHISNILSRLGLRDRTQAAIYAREAGLL